MMTGARRYERPGTASRGRLPVRRGPVPDFRAANFHIGVPLQGVSENVVQRVFDQRGGAG